MTQDGPPQDADANPAAVARSIILRQLALAPKSRHQLAQKLAEKHVPDEVAQAVLDRFEEVKLINDGEFAELWVRSRFRNKQLSRGALERELAEKGIDPQLSQEALEQVSAADERAGARHLVQKKLGAARNLADRTERDKYTRRWVAMLARKGYPPSLAFGVVSEVIDEALEAADAGDLPED